MKQEITIRCPNYRAKIDINEALYEELESQFNQETIEKRQAYKKAMDELHVKEQLIKTQEASFEQKLQEQLQLQLQTQRVKLNQEMQLELEKQQSLQSLNIL